MKEPNRLNRRPLAARMLVSQGVLEKSDFGDGTEPFVLDHVARWVVDDLSVGQRIKLLEDSSVTAPFPRIWAEYRAPHTDCLIGVLMVSTELHLEATVYGTKYGALGVRAGTLSVDLDEGGFVASDAIFRFKTPTSSEDARHVTVQGMWVCIAAFALLNAKNVTAPRHLPNRAVRRQRARDSNGNDPFLCYRMLRIEAPHGNRDSRGSGKTTSLPLTAQHIVRGHWAVYTEENPMFGRLGDDRFVGRFWVTPHLRGDQSKGAIAKGYAVEPGNEALV